MTTGWRNLRRQIGSTTVARHMGPVDWLLAGFYMLVSGLVGIVWPLYVWFWIRPSAPEITPILLVLVAAGWVINIMLWRGRITS